jgi:hypothetical protein
MILPGVDMLASYRATNSQMFYSSALLNPTYPLSKISKKIKIKKGYEITGIY